MKSKFLLFFFFIFSILVLGQRKVDCTGANLNINSTQLDYYAWQFDNFVDVLNRTANSTLIFESLESLSFVSLNAIDLSEYIVKIRMIQQKIDR